MFCHFVWVALLIFKSISLCLFLFFKYNSCGFCPGYKETLAHMTYILELAEANGKDSDALVAQAWYVLCWWILHGLCWDSDGFLLKVWWVLHRNCWDSDGFLLKFWWVLHRNCWDSDGFWLKFWWVLHRNCWDSDGFLLKFWWVLHRNCWDSDGFLLKFWWILHRNCWDSDGFLLKFWWVLHRNCWDSDGFCWSSDGFCIGIVETLMDFCWSSDGFCIGIVEILMDCCWSSDGFCIGIVEILMDFCWSSDGFCIGIVEILMDFCWILHCPVSSWQVEWPNEDLKPLPLSAKESMQRRREALMWGSDAGLCCFAGLVKEPWLSLVSEWSSHMVLWCFLLISKCLLLGSDCVVVGLHGVLWVECLWDGFLLTPGSGCSTALCCWASEPANLCTADLSLCTPTFGVLSRSISWISKSC